MGILEIQRILLSDSPITLNKTQSERSIDREVQWILSRALEKQKDRRYSSVASFAEDLSRYLRRQPVEAGPPSGIYLVSKFIARHRVAATGTILAALVLITSTIVSIRQSRIARQERANSERELYYTEMRLASDSAWDYDISFAKRILERNDPALEPRTWKGVEWNFLNAMLQRKAVRSRNCGSRILQLGLSSNNRFLAVLAEKKSIEIWDAHNLETLISIDSNAYNVCVAWHPTLNRFAASGSDRNIHVYDITEDPLTQNLSYTYVQQFEAHPADVNGLAFSPNGEWLVSTGDDDLIRIWDAANWQQKNQTRAKCEGLQSIKFSTKGDMLVGAGTNGSTKTWSFPELKPLTSGYDNPGRIRTASFNESGNWIASGNINGTLTIEEVTGKKRVAERHLLDGIEQLTVLKGLDRVVTADRGANLALHSINTSRNLIDIESNYLDRWQVGSTRLIALCQLSAEILITADQSGNVSQWKLNRPAYHPITLDIPVNANEFRRIAKLSDSKIFVIPIFTDQLHVYDFESNTHEQKLTELDYTIHEMHYSPSSKLLYAGGSDRLENFAYPSMMSVASWPLPGGCASLSLSEDESKILCLTAIPGGCIVQCFAIGKENPLFDFEFKGGRV